MYCGMTLYVLQVAAPSRSKARSSGASRSQGLHPPKDPSRHRSEGDAASEASELEKFRLFFYPYHLKLKLCP